jgi:hypothetical protein
VLVLGVEQLTRCLHNRHGPRYIYPACDQYDWMLRLHIFRAGIFPHVLQLGADVASACTETACVPFCADMLLHVLHAALGGRQMPATWAFYFVLTFSCAFCMYCLYPTAPGGQQVPATCAGQRPVACAGAAVRDCANIHPRRLLVSCFGKRGTTAVEKQRKRSNMRARFQHRTWDKGGGCIVVRSSTGKSSSHDAAAA